VARVVSGGEKSFRRQDSGRAEIRRGYLEELLVRSCCYRNRFPRFLSWSLGLGDKNRRSRA
jgi:hypothetical protein